MKKMGSLMIVLLLILAVMPVSAQEVTLTMQASQGWTDEADEHIADMFFKESGVRIEFQIVPADQHHDLLKTKLSVGEAPDIFWIQASPLNIYGELDPENNCLDITGAAWEKLMPQARIEAVSYNGKLYGQAIWNKSVSFPIAYNKTLFSELDLEIPRTFEAFKQVCQTLLDNGVIPIYETIPDGWHHGLIVTHVGGRIEQLMPDVIEKLNTNQIKLKETPFIDALRQAKELVDLGYYGDDWLSNSGNDTQEVLVNREYAMVVGHGTVQGIKKDYPDAADEFGLFLIPLLDNQTSQSDPYGPAKFINKHTQYPDQAKAYFEFCMRPENLQYKLDNSGDSWTTLDVTDEAGVTQRYSPEELELMSTITDDDYGVVFQNRVKYFNDQWMEYCKDLTSYFMGDIEAEQLCDLIDERRANMAVAQGDPNWQ